MRVDTAGPTTIPPVMFGSVIVMSLPVEFDVAMIVDPVLDPFILIVALVPLKFNWGLVYNKSALSCRI